jgi:hypothetical protein
MHNKKIVLIHPETASFFEHHNVWEYSHWTARRPKLGQSVNKCKSFHKFTNTEFCLEVIKSNVLLCYDYHNGIIHEEKDIMFATKP